MIIRLVRVIATPDRAATLNAHFRDVAQPRIRACQGNAGIWYGRQVRRDREEFMMMSRWVDHAALRGWTGPDVNALPLLPNIAELAIEWTVQHFEELVAEDEAEPAVDPARRKPAKG
jgi:antibiotic biosynthesis monooxygenase